MTTFRAAVSTASIALVVVGGSLFAGEAAAEPDDEQQWFEHCIGSYEPDADWYQNCQDQLDDYDCQDWVACLESETEFVQTRTCSPTGGLNPCQPGEHPYPVQWYRDSVEYLINAYGTEDLHPGESEITDEVKHDVFDSFDVWNDVDCSFFEMNYDGLTTSEAHFNQHDLDANTNVVTWMDDDWPHDHYRAIALTTVTFSTNSGEILGADIELNTADYQFTNTDDDNQVEHDLRNTLVHEVGHFLGLDHSPHPEATMYATAEQGETKKRHLHEADIEGICHIYREGRTPSEPPGGSATNDDGNDRRAGCGCNAAGGTAAAPLLALLMLFGLRLVSRRRPA